MCCTVYRLSVKCSQLRNLLFVFFSFFNNTSLVSEARTTQLTKTTQLLLLHQVFGQSSIIWIKRKHTIFQSASSKGIYTNKQYLDFCLQYCIASILNLAILSNLRIYYNAYSQYILMYFHMVKLIPGFEVVPVPLLSLEFSKIGTTI